MIDILPSIDGDLVGPRRPDLAGLVHWGGGATLPIHRWFRYREGFSPALIPELGLGSRILDPFCGSGSIMVGAAQQDRTSVGIDVNPLAAFVAGVKLSPLTDRDVAAAGDFLAGFEAALPGVRAVARPGAADRRRRSSSPASSTPCSGSGRSSRNGPTTKAQRRFLLLAWLSILQTVGSYFKEGNGIKYRNRQRRRGGYVARPEGRWQLERFGADQDAFVRAAFRAGLAGMLEDVPAWRHGRWSAQRVIEGNALEEAQHLEAGSFDSVLFSPPYANRFDYFESQKVELWFGGFVDSYGEMTVLRKRSLRSHLGAALDRPTVSRPDVEALIGMIDPGSYAARMRVPALLRGYFSDMAAVLRRCRRLLVPGGPLLRGGRELGLRRRHHPHRLADRPARPRRRVRHGPRRARPPPHRRAATAQRAAGPGSVDAGERRRAVMTAAARRDRLHPLRGGRRLPAVGRDRPRPALRSQPVGQHDGVHPRTAPLRRQVRPPGSGLGPRQLRRPGHRGARPVHGFGHHAGGGDPAGRHEHRGRHRPAGPVHRPGAETVQVFIGAENAPEEMRDVSLVLAPYGEPGRAVGVVGVLGPTRMAYAQAIGRSASSPPS